MAAERVALEPREQVVEDLLADAPAAARRELQVLAVAGQVAGRLEAPGQGVERVEVAHRVVAEQVADLVAVQAGEVVRAVDVGERVAQAIHRRELVDPGEGARETERLVAAERHALAEPARQQQVEVRGQLGEVDEQAVVPEEGLHHRLELGPLLRAHRAEQRLHRGHPLPRAAR